VGALLLALAPVVAHARALNTPAAGVGKHEVDGDKAGPVYEATVYLRHDGCVACFALSFALCPRHAKLQSSDAGR
jgi:hypothetical protein